MATKPDYIDEIPDLIKEFAVVFSAHNRLSNRIWLLATTLTLIVVGTSGVPTLSTVKFAGFEFSRASFFPISALLLVLINIAYCSAHTQAYRVAEAFREMVKKFDPDEMKLISDTVSLENAAYMLVMPNYNRIHPIFHDRTPKGEARWYRAIKLIADVCFILVPWIGIFAALSASFAALSASEEKNYIFWASVLILIFSAYSSFVVFCKALRYSRFAQR